VWNLSSQSIVATLNGHQSAVNSLLCLNDGRLVSGSSDGTIQVWNRTNQGTLLTRIAITNQLSVNALELLGDGSLAVGLADGSIQIQNMTTYLSVKRLTNQISTSPLSSLKVLANGNLASSFADCTVLIWSLVSFTQIAAQIGGSLSATYGVALDQLNDGSLVGGHLNQQSIKVWDANRKLVYNSYTSSQLIEDLKTLASGNVAIAGKNGLLEIWQMNKYNATCLYQLSQQTDKPNIFALALVDSQTFVAAFETGFIALVRNNQLAGGMGLNNSNVINVLAVGGEN
jgi:WD40 repeat protein